MATDGREPWQMRQHEYCRLDEAQRVPRGTILALPLEGMTAGTLEPWRTEQLRLLAQLLGAPHGRPREPLIEVILVYASLRVRLKDETSEQLQSLKRAELLALAKPVGIYTNVNKYGLANALIGWRDRKRLDGRNVVGSANHYRHVRRAVRLGLPVPTDVLSDYPDLQEQPGDYPLFEAIIKDNDQ